jgi:hypothetical protein
MVGEQHGPNLTDRAPQAVQSLADLAGAPRQPGVDEHHTVVRHHQVHIHVPDRHLEHSVDHFTHPVIFAPALRCPCRNPPQEVPMSAEEVISLITALGGFVGVLVWPAVAR